MPDYTKGKIYSIRSHQTDEVYIGSTISPLSKRMGQHREKYNKWKKGEHHYFTCFKLLDLGDAYIELVQDCPCENKQQLERREGEIMRITQRCINKQIAGRTWEEYYEDNGDKIRQRVNEYRLNNLEVINEKKKQYYEENKEKILQKKKNNYEVNKEKLLEQQKKYREKNKAKIQAYMKEYRENKKLSSI